ncbi:RecQ family helicase-topoisomerase III complex protein [Malassezia pachydermatis]
MEAAQPTPRLLQITHVMDVGVSAQALRDIFAARHTEPGTPFPRGMLRWHLSDGHQSKDLVAYEYTPIPALSLDTPLGTKILVRECVYDDQVLLLEAPHIHILGGFVPEWNIYADLAAQISEKLSVDVKPWPASNALPPARRVEASHASSAPARPLSSMTEVKAPTATVSAAPPSLSEPWSDDVMDEWDWDAESALREAEQAYSSTPTAKHIPPPMTTDPTSSTIPMSCSQHSSLSEARYPSSSLLQKLERDASAPLASSPAMSASQGGRSQEQLYLPIKSTSQRSTEPSIPIDVRSSPSPEARPPPRREYITLLDSD